VLLKQKTQESTKAMQTPLQIFVSYAKEDREYYEQLETTARHLVRQGIVALWNPHDAIPAGTPVREEISQHLQQASLIFLLFSPDSLADDACYAQIQQAIQIGEREPDRVWIILLRPCGWKEIWEAIEHKGHFHFLPRNCRPLSNWPIPDRDDIAQDIASEITESVRRVRQREPTAEGPVTPPVVRLPNPYRGLLSFRIEDAPFFYGRERLTSEVLEKITEMLTPRNMQKEQRLLAIIGASGAGKSSLLHAGVLPCLMRGELAGSEAWMILRTLTLYPGENPLDNLADVLCDHLPAQERSAIQDRLARSPSELGYIVNDIMRSARRGRKISPGAYVVLVIDQFEACLKQETQKESQHLINLLVTAATRPEYPLLILMTCRANFYEELMKHNDFFELLRAHEVILNEPMTLSEMRAAIEAPVQNLNRAFGSDLRFEDGLVDQLIVDFRGQAEALPFLQFTLCELFARRQDLLLTRRAYQEIQGGHGALAEHAESIYRHLREREKEVRRLFLSLVKVSMGEELNIVVARQRVGYAQVLSPDTPASGAERSGMEKIIQAFVDGRLLSADGRGERRTLEISHEVLLQAWPRLETWIRKNEDTLYQKSSATQDARNWQRHGQPTQDLYTGSKLKQLNTLAKHGLVVGNDEPFHTFFRQSQTRRQRKMLGRICIVFVILLLLAPAAYNIANSSLTSHQIRVTSSGDAGPGSLRQALLDVRPDKTTIVLDAGIPDKSIKLSNDLIFAANDDNVTLQGNGVVVTAPSGQQIDIFPGISVTFDHLRLEGSQPLPEMARGGVIFNQGFLRLVDCVIQGNQSNYNGGALVNTGDLVLDHTTFSHNVSPGYGGAIYNNNGSVSINFSLLQGNQARGGGGLYSMRGTVIVEQSWITQNVAGTADGSRYFGGGIALRNATLTMRDSTVQSNTVYGDGGGLSLLDSSASLDASTITENTARIANPSASPAWGGGGIAVDISNGKNPSSQARIVNMSLPDTTKVSRGTISKNSVQLDNNAGSGTSRATQDILGKWQGNDQRSFFVIAAQSTPVPPGYPPSQGAPPENLEKNYIGNIDIDLLCQINGSTQGEPMPNDLSFIICGGSEKSFSAADACSMLDPSATSATTRLYDYYDLSTWECYNNVHQVSSFAQDSIPMMTEQMSAFCRSHIGTGIQAQLYQSKRTAYSWQCEDKPQRFTGISMADVCRFVNQNMNAFERLKNFNSPQGWECWAP
jgi:predicted outer membrane repeat protein